MRAIVSMLRAVNLGAHNRVSMEALRTLYGSLQLRDARTYVQSGHVVFRTSASDLPKLARKIEDGIERTFGFRTQTILRTASEMRETIANNPFAGRAGIEPAKLLVTFLAAQPGETACEQIRRLKTDPEEVSIRGREIYIYFPNGAGRSKLSWMKMEKMLATPGTARNWNSVTKLLEMAESLETSA